ARAKEIGEAVVVDLPNGDTLFALLKAGQAFDAFLPQIEADYDISGSCGGMRAMAEGLSSRDYQAVIAAENYPKFVRFRDLSDPASVAHVNPDNLADSFGGDYTLQRLVIETTDEKVTQTIAGRLVWLGNNPEPHLDNDFAPTTDPTLSQLLRHGDFRRR
ncbi:hypothetical protein KCG44_14295, partial [Pacificimonas sp. WHA3]